MNWREPTSPVSRWPLHPRPGPLESLSSWLSRLAALYGMRVDDLLGKHNLDLGDVEAPLELDIDPPEQLLVALAERTGVDLERLRTMTWIDWSPWLFDWPFYLPLDQRQPMFDNYVRANSVLLAPGEAGTNVIGYPQPWYGSWHSRSWGLRACPVCDPNEGIALVWRLPLLLGCGEHGCYLENPSKIDWSRTTGEPITPRPVPEPLATMERYTHAALTTGRVDLPGRSVHAGVWFRLLRSLLDEVSLALTPLRAESRALLEQVWDATGLPERGGLNVWQPYEDLPLEAQQSMLLAAATALELAADGTITARGRLASALAPSRRHVYDGDLPDPPDPLAPAATAWAEMMARIEEVIEQARADRDTAHQLLSLLTLGARTPARFEDQRAYLFGIGVPAEFLPTARDFGRDDLA